MISRLYAANLKPRENVTSTRKNPFAFYEKHPDYSGHPRLEQEVTSGEVELSENY